MKEDKFWKYALYISLAGHIALIPVASAIFNKVTEPFHESTTTFYEVSMAESAQEQASENSQPTEQQPPQEESAPPEPQEAVAVPEIPESMKPEPRPEQPKQEVPKQKPSTLPKQQPPVPKNKKHGQPWLTLRTLWRTQNLRTQHQGKPVPYTSQLVSMKVAK